jgi:hypothetical protein
MVDGEWRTHAKQEEVCRRVVPRNGPRGKDHHSHMVSQVGDVQDRGIETGKRRMWGYGDEWADLLVQLFTYSVIQSLAN